MPKDHGTTLTRLFVTSAWWMSSHLAKHAVKELTVHGWEEERGGRSGFRCLTKFDANMKPLRRAAKKNPGLILLAFTASCETDDIILQLGIGGIWLTKTPGPLEALGLGRGICPRDYVHSMGTKPASEKRVARPRKSSARCQVAAKKPKPQSVRRARTACKAVPVPNRLVFHGLPDEVERCRLLALEILPEAARDSVKYGTKGSDSYASGILEFTTDAEPAFRAFNRLVAQVPGVTVVLEYDDLKSVARRQLRAVDGRIVEHRAI